MLLAAIGEVESSSLAGTHARCGARRRAPGARAGALGRGFAAIRDTDGGRYDGDPVWDRAVGPMQFIPVDVAALGRATATATASTTRRTSRTRRSPPPLPLRRGPGPVAAGGPAGGVLSYNHSQQYLATVSAHAGGRLRQLAGPLTAARPGTDDAPSRRPGHPLSVTG